MKIVCISGKAQHGKDTTAGYLKEYLEKRGNSVLITHYGDLVKYVCTTFFDWDGLKDEDGRTLLQHVGTDIVRKKAPQYWVNFVCDMIKFFEGRWNYVLIPDCRFPNEVVCVQQKFKDVFHVRVIRKESEDWSSPLTEEQRNHPSETSLDGYPCDIVIPNYGDLDSLKSNVEFLCETLTREE